MLFLGTVFNAAQTLNAAELYVGGVPSNVTLPDDLAAPTNALVGCFESPYFNAYSILEESPERLDFSDSSISQTRYDSIELSLIPVFRYFVKKV